MLGPSRQPIHTPQGQAKPRSPRSVMNRLPIVALGLFIGLFAAITSGPALAEKTPPIITNFKFGLICGVPGNRRVCFPTDAIQVTNESMCVFNQSPIRCTWYGFSFDYDASSDTEINC